MSKYTISCSKEQIEKSLKLGAEEEYLTAEEMIGWIEDQEEVFELLVSCYNNKWFYSFYMTARDRRIGEEGYSTRPEATLAGIDAALEYLIDIRK